jgi:hypothetical protein
MRMSVRSAERNSHSCCGRVLAARERRRLPAPERIGVLRRSAARLYCHAEGAAIPDSPASRECRTDLTKRHLLYFRCRWFTGVGAHPSVKGIGWGLSVDRWGWINPSLARAQSPFLAFFNPLCGAERR